MAERTNEKPTTALTRRVIDTLFAVIRRLQQANISVLFVSHKLNEVLEISEQITNIKLSVEIPPYNYTIPIFMLVILGVISIFQAFQLRRADAKQRFELELPSGVKPE